MIASNVVRRSRSIGVIIALAFGALAGVARSAHAEPTPQEKTLATTLFNEAKDLLDAGRTAEACRKLEESRRLHPLPGTILNLAACHEKEGRLASAFAEFREARSLALRDHRDDRVAFADERLKEIEPRISQLVIVIEPDADRADLRITYDGLLLGRPAWGGRVPVDPGEHVIEASAPGKKTWRATITVGSDADVQRAVIPALEDEPLGTTAAIPEVVPVLGPTTTSDTTASSHGLSTRRTIALVTGGIGVVGLGLGTYFGVRAIDKHNDDAAVCTTTPCSSESLLLNDQAKTAADAATVSVIVGAVALGVAAFLWFGDTEAKPARRIPSLLTF